MSARQVIAVPRRHSPPGLPALGTVTPGGPPLEVVNASGEAITQIRMDVTIMKLQNGDFPAAWSWNEDAQLGYLLPGQSGHLRGGVKRLDGYVTDQSICTAEGLTRFQVEVF
jgi:hypothetical protein